MAPYGLNLSDPSRWWRLEFSIAGQDPAVRHAIFDSTRIAVDGAPPPVGNLPPAAR